MEMKSEMGRGNFREGGSNRYQVKSAENQCDLGGGGGDSQNDIEI